MYHGVGSGREGDACNETFSAVGARYPTIASDANGRLLAAVSKDLRPIRNPKSEISNLKSEIKNPKCLLPSQLSSIWTA